MCGEPKNVRKSAHKEKCLGSAGLTALGGVLEDGAGIGLDHHAIDQVALHHDTDARKPRLVVKFKLG
jgi:hypothetical protein